MSEFSCDVVRVEIEPHPNADAIELARVGDYVSIVQKGQFKTGDLAVYIPEAALVPYWMLEEMGLQGKLSGKDKNRVKAIKLRGVLSQGLLYPVSEISENGETKFYIRGEGAIDYLASQNDYLDVEEGDDVTEFLGITKYEPPIPTQMQGLIRGDYFDYAFKYDFDNIKKHKDLFKEGEDVSITEKIHGTFMVFGILPSEIPFNEGLPSRYLLSSKGMFAKGQVIDIEADENDTNLYVRAASKYQLVTRMHRLFRATSYPVYLLGEVYGGNVQDLGYGIQKGDLHFRAFDIAVKRPDGLKFFDDEMLDLCLDDMGLERVPVLYRGPYSKEAVLDYTEGNETLSGKNSHMREGVVVRSTMARVHPRHGRVIAKSINERYLMRKNATEFN